MSQLDALDFALTPPEPRPRVTVRQVSIAAYTAGREHLKGRPAKVLAWLAWYYNRHLQWPTARELQRAIAQRDQRLVCDHCMALYIRKGVTELQQLGMVRAHGERRCTVGKRIVTAWAVIPVGR